jgi:hypothetical protein
MGDPTAADPGRPDMIRADHPRQVLVTCGDHGVIRITITDHEGLTHVFMHGAGPLYYVETRKDDRDGER